jgi:hypothetical protein
VLFDPDTVSEPFAACRRERVTLHISTLVEDEPRIHIESSKGFNWQQQLGKPERLAEAVEALFAAQHPLPDPAQAAVLLEELFRRGAAVDAACFVNCYFRAAAASNFSVEVYVRSAAPLERIFQQPGPDLVELLDGAVRALRKAGPLEIGEPVRSRPDPGLSGGAA